MSSISNLEHESNEGQNRAVPIKHLFFRYRSTVRYPKPPSSLHSLQTYKSCLLTLTNAGKLSVPVFRRVQIPHSMPSIQVLQRVLIDNYTIQREREKLRKLDINRTIILLWIWELVELVLKVMVVKDTCRCR